MIKILTVYSKSSTILESKSGRCKRTREREIHFSAILKERVGHHYFGENGPIK
jgi:hypothetical protein